MHYNAWIGITYKATEKLAETSYSGSYYSGIYINAFNTRIISHVFNNGIGKIEFADSVTSIGDNAFQNNSGLTNINIPDSVTSIGNNAFSSCSSLTSIIIPNGVTSIGYSTFYNCTNLTNITSLATTAPTIQNNTFYNVPSGGTLTVPIGSTGYDTWMGTNYFYLGYYNWTKVEQ